MTNDTQARPDLSGLGRLETRIDVEVALTQGGEWKHQGGMFWLLRGPSVESSDLAAFYADDRDSFRRYHLPRYTSDPAALRQGRRGQRSALL